MKSRIFHNGMNLRFGNLMISYLVANRLALDVDRLQFSNFLMPYWNILEPDIIVNQDLRRSTQRTDQRFDFTRASYLLNSDLVEVIEYYGYGQRMENFPAIDVSRRLFKTSQDIGKKFGPTKVICPIRAGEILEAPHPGYTLIPIGFYREMFDKLHLDPVFVGQTAIDNPYISSLREAFKNATFVEQKSTMDDFQTIRLAHTIILPVSTFAWIAAWLSNAKKIILPSFGLYNQNRYPEHNLLPLSDDRYTFFQFPIQDAVPVDNVEEAHKKINGEWKEVSASKLLKL